MAKRTDVRHDDLGHEILDNVPIAPPLGYKRAPSLAEQIRQQVLAHKLEALSELMETEDEADDFEIDDDVEPYSQHENEGMPTLRELRVKAKEINAEIEKRNLQKLKETYEKQLDKKREPAKPAPPAEPEKAAQPNTSE